MKLLITGAKGQVGTELALDAKHRDHQVYAYGSKELDISQLDQIDQKVKQLQPDVIINSAAYTAVDKAETEQTLAYLVNAQGSENLAITAKKYDIPLLHISTDYIYDGDKKTAYRETDPENPIGVYGASKLAGDQKIIETWHKHIILRVSWVFGASGNNFVKTMLRLAEQRDELSIVNDQFGAPTSAKAISGSLLALLQSPLFNQANCPWGVYNLQSDPGVTWYEFAQEIFSQAQQTGLLDKTIKLNPIPSSQFPTPVTRPKNSKLNGEKLQKTFALPIADWKKDLSVMLGALNA
ncbi:MAG: dTDP-4-dehydrorhamnose reductase [Thiotrichaceae bacterium]|nr:dTDP-4-dehydrorhamnose reductase [Thiotrichaceae bacterium]